MPELSVPIAVAASGALDAGGAAGLGAAAGGAGMSSLLGPAIGAGAGLLGNFLSSQGQSATNSQMIANQRWMLQQQENWMTDMSNTAMQRRVADLKAANLNPLLAITAGAASQPSIGMSAPQLANPQGAQAQLGAQVSNALQLRQQQAAIDLMDQQGKQAGAQADYTAGAQTDLARAQARVQAVTEKLLIPAQAAAADAGAQLDQASRARIEQQINSGDIHAQIALMAQQSKEASARAYMDLAIGKMDNMTAIEKQYAMPFVIRQMGYAVQSSALSIPEKQSLANYFETTLGQGQWKADQERRWIGTATDVIRTISGAAGRGGSSAAFPGTNTTPGYTLGQGSPIWPSNE